LLPPVSPSVGGFSLCCFSFFFNRSRRPLQESPSTSTVALIVTPHSCLFRAGVFLGGTTGFTHTDDSFAVVLGFSPPLWALNLRALVQTFFFQYTLCNASPPRPFLAPFSPINPQPQGPAQAFFMAPSDLILFLPLFFLNSFFERAQVPGPAFYPLFFNEARKTAFRVLIEPYFLGPAAGTLRRVFFCSHLCRRTAFFSMQAFAGRVAGARSRVPPHSLLLGLTGPCFKNSSFSPLKRPLLEFLLAITGPVGPVPATKNGLGEAPPRYIFFSQLIRGPFLV